MKQKTNLSVDPTVDVDLGKAEMRVFDSGITSTRQTRLSLIPHRGLINAAARFELGLATHKGTAYNALGNADTNARYLADTEWLIERCSHAIEHCYNLIDYLTGNDKPTNIVEGVERALGDAGAIAFCGLTLGEALSATQQKLKRSTNLLERK